MRLKTRIIALEGPNIRYVTRIRGHEHAMCIQLHGANRRLPKDIIATGRHMLQLDQKHTFISRNLSGMLADKRVLSYHWAGSKGMDYPQRCNVDS
jgi:hypothetical protein